MVAITQTDEKFDISRLKSLAQAQRYLCYCILFHFMLWFTFFVLIISFVTLNIGPDFRMLIESFHPYTIIFLYAIILFVAIAMQIYALVCSYKLSRIRFDSILAAILLTIAVTVLPAFGILVLIGINISATVVLKRAGIRVGFLGAKMSQFDS